MLKAPLQTGPYIPEAGAPFRWEATSARRCSNARARGRPPHLPTLAEGCEPHVLRPHHTPAPAPITASSPAKASQGHGGPGRNCAGWASHPPRGTSPVTVGPVTSTANSKDSFFESKRSLKGKDAVFHLFLPENHNKQRLAVDIQGR